MFAFVIAKVKIASKFEFQSHVGNRENGTIFGKLKELVTLLNNSYGDKLLETLTRNYKAQVAEYQKGIGNLVADCKYIKVWSIGYGSRRQL